MTRPAILMALAGFASFVAGVALIYPPAALILGGALAAAAGLLIDFQRGER